MKHRALGILAGLALLCSLAGCKRDDDDDATPAPAKTCRIGTATFSFSGDSVVYTISYDGSGRLTSVSQRQAGTFFTRSFAYSGNAILITASNTGDRDSVVTNSDGLVVYHRRTPASPGYQINTEYSYSGAEVQRRITTYLFSTTPSQSDTSFFFWSGGNMIREDQMGVTTLYEYYTDKAIPPTGGDVRALFYTLIHGAAVVRNKHLLKSVTSFGGPVSNVLYDFDGSGKVTGVHLSTASSSGTADYRFDYTCE